MPQHSIDVTGDVRPVLGADVASAVEIVCRDIVGWAIARVDRGEDIDPGGDLCSGSQEVEERIASLPNPSSPGHDEEGGDKRDDAIKIDQQSCG